MRGAFWFLQCPTNDPTWGEIEIARSLSLFRKTRLEFTPPPKELTSFFIVHLIRNYFINEAVELEKWKKNTHRDTWCTIAKTGGVCEACGAS